MDRLARDLVKQMLVEEQLRKAGARIEYVLGEYPDTPEGTLNKQIRAVVAEFERQKITERSIRGRRASAQAGNVLGGRAPYGYQFTDDHLHLEIVEAEAAIIRLIYTWYTDGDGDGPLSSTQIAAKLSALRVPTWADTRGSIVKTAGFGVWSARVIITIIHSQTYAGTYYYGRANGGVYNPREAWIAVAVPPIVDNATWAAAQAQLQRNKTIPAHPTQHAYLLRGRLTCGECGGNIYAITDSHNAPHYWRYYRCGAKVKGRAACSLPGFRVDYLDTAVWDWLTAVLLDPARLAAGLAALQEQELMDDTESDHTALLSRAAAIRAQSERLLDLYISGNLEKTAYLQRQTVLAAEFALVENTRTALEQAAQHSAPPTDAELHNAAAFAAAIADELTASDFTTRQRITSALDIRGSLYQTPHATISLGLPRAWRYDKYINKSSYIPRIRLSGLITLSPKRPR
jgi:site-specific DNA recombinase